MKWFGWCVVFGFVFIVDVHMRYIWNGRWFGDREDVSTARDSWERKELRKEKRRKKKREKWFEGKKHLFAFLWLCLSLHPSPLFNPPCRHSSSYTITHYTPQSTPHHHTHHATQQHLCSVLILCVWLSVHSIRQHNIQTISWCFCHVQSFFYHIFSKWFIVFDY